MIFAQKYETDLKALLANPHYPIIADREFALRGIDFCSGVSGIICSLGDNAFKPILLPSNMSDLDIFTCTFLFLEDSISIESHKILTKEPFLNLGDLFYGECNSLWAHLVLGQHKESRYFIDSPGKKISKGLAHGELIRDFTKWFYVHEIEKCEFSTSEFEFDSFAWCNGLSGFLVIEILVDILKTEKIVPKFSISHFDALIDLIQISEVQFKSFNLCHGLAGASVVLAGVARYFEDLKRLNKVREIFQKIFDKNQLIEFRQDNQVDSSWLTGVAGLIWANKVIERRPYINPIVPFDSEIFAAKYKP